MISKLNLQCVIDEYMADKSPLAERWAVRCNHEAGNYYTRTLWRKTQALNINKNIHNDTYRSWCPRMIVRSAAGQSRCSTKMIWHESSRMRVCNDHDNGCHLKGKKYEWYKRNTNHGNGYKIDRSEAAGKTIRTQDTQQGVCMGCFVASANPHALLLVLCVKDVISMILLRNLVSNQ